MSTPHLAYTLPPELLARYHDLCSTKCVRELTDEEREEMDAVMDALNKADADTPLERYIAEQEDKRHARVMAEIDAIQKQLERLK
ncbi:MAG TPA: hypothetical protein VNH18_08165 [Bryobacteraceae bacterium]|nr:hypothetical protein [Bryobacteraceae bacterium]